MKTGQFTPFVCSVDWALGKEAVGFLKCIAHKLAIKWHHSYSVIMGFVSSLEFRERASEVFMYSCSMRAKDPEA